MIAGGVVALGIALERADGVPSVLALLVAAAFIVLGNLPIVHVRHGAETHTFNWSEASLVAGLVVLPTWWLPVVGAVVHAGYYAAVRRSPAKVAFNGLGFAIAATLATTAEVVVLAAIPGARFAALGAACVVYFVWNTASVSLAVALSGRDRFCDVVRSGLLLASLFAVANSSVAVLVTTAATQEPMVLLVLPPVLVQLLVAYRNTREIIGERDLWVAVRDASEALQRADAGEVHRVALEAVVALADATTVELLTVDGEQAWRHRRVDAEVQTTAGSLGALADDIWGRAVCDRVPFWLHQATATTRQRRWFDAEGVQSVLVVPLEWGGTVVGLLRVGFARHSQRAERTASALATVGTQLASVLTSHRQTATLRHQAEHDELTGLPNRTTLVQHLQQRLDAGAPGSLAVLFFDLDGFKVVNDSLGHHVGDQLLLEATRRLRSQMRPDDVIARFGGDEFIVVCDGIARPHDAVEVAQRLLDAMLEPATEGPHWRPISASVGVACAEEGADPESLLRDADAAMYQAKRIGPGSASLFTAELRTQALNRLHLEADLREALRQGQIEVHYQPIVDLATGRICELEALARWYHPERGPVSPESFINVAEESGHIRALGAFVLHQACADMRRWLDLGIAGPGQRVAVNLSPLQLDAGLPTLVADALARHGLPPTALTLEVTESAFVDDPDAVASLDRLRHLGICVALDDFGTGYSSLSALRDLPVDTVKIDRSFVSRLGEDAQLEALVRGIVSLAGALELRVVGEGVEAEDQSRLLASLGCDRAQGWLHGRPASAATTEAVLSASPGARRPIDRVERRATVHPLRLA